LVLAFGLAFLFRTAHFMKDLEVLGMVIMIGHGMPCAKLFLCFALRVGRFADVCMRRAGQRLYAKACT